jgi:cytolysin (calcineurin-like family phosphatase)
MKRREFIGGITFAAIALQLQSCRTLFGKSTDVTFFVAADTHFDPPPETDQYFHIRAMNNIPGNYTWPAVINGKPTAFKSINQKVQEPAGVILAGDILDKADPSALMLFRQRYEKGTGDKQIHFSVYAGLGNHDVDPVIDEPLKTQGRKRMLSYIESRYKGADAPVVVDNFDPCSYSYSWSWGDLHLVQTHLFAGSSVDNRPGNLEWLSADLAHYAYGNKPVVIFQHYGFDPWALTWWTDNDRKNLFRLLKQYNVVAIFAGHTHTVINMKYKGVNIFQVNNAWPDTDGNGSFAIVRITDSFIDMATCRWINDKGTIEWVEPYYSQKF